MAELQQQQFVRVRDPETGHELTVTRGFAAVTDVVLIPKTATDAAGAPLPPKYRVSVEQAVAKKPASRKATHQTSAAPAAAKKSGQKADSKEEDDQ